jgi:hypothetical protein
LSFLRRQESSFISINNTFRYGKIKTPVFRGPGIFVDGHFKRMSNLELPINETQAEKIVKEFCEPSNQDYKYGYESMKKINNEWRIPITNLNCPCYATVNTGAGETNCMKQVSFGIENQVSITTDKTEYEKGEIVKITVKNNLDNPVKYLKGVGCGLQGFSSKNKEWMNVSSRSCKWDGEDKLKPDSEYNFNWTASKLGLEKYRIAFYYQEQELIETKEIGKIICEGKKLPDKLEELLLDGKWAMGDVFNKGCAMCDVCGCSCTMKNAWAISEAVIDVHLVSCSGNSYTIKYKGEEYNCVSENYKNSFHGLPILIPSEDWNVIYSNEFTIKEKSALDARCSEKVKDLSGVNDIDCAVILFGYEYDSVTEKCVTKAVDGCSFETPFNSLEECREVCEKDGNIILPDEDELIKCGNNNDCALVNSGCCGCSMGGGVTCINKKYLGDWSQKLRLDCEGSIVCPAVYLCDTNPTGCECINNICRGTGGDLTKL